VKFSSVKDWIYFVLIVLWIMKVVFV